MDILSHALLGAAAVTQKSLIIPGLFFGMGPDLLNGIPTWSLRIYGLRKEGRKWRGVWRRVLSPLEWQSAPVWMHTSYLYIHSFIVALLIYLFLYFFYPSLVILMRAWFLHLVIDVFTHKEWFAIKPLYPLSRWQLEFFNWFETPLKYLGVVISIIIFAFVYLYPSL